MNDTKLRIFTRITGISVFAVLAAGVIGCTPQVEVRGYVADEELVEEIMPGIDNKDSVESTLGTPSAVGTFDNNTWYYVSEITRNLAFFKPKTLDQQVLVVHFDDQGSVDQIYRYTLDDARQITMVSRETPTRGRELGFFEQIFGNIGRFGGASGGRGPGPGP